MKEFRNKPQGLNSSLQNDEHSFDIHGENLTDVHSIELVFLNQEILEILESPIIEGVVHETTSNKYSCITISIVNCNNS